jgi:gluconokinase
VLACSALKERYRRRLSTELPDVRWIYLKGELELVRSRLSERRHRYMPASLLDSQFAALEPPADAIVINVAATPEECLAGIMELLRQD